MRHDSLSGEAWGIGHPYAPAVTYDDDGHRIRDTYRLDPPLLPPRPDHDHIGHDSRQRRRAAAREALFREADGSRAPRRRRRAAARVEARRQYRKAQDRAGAGSETS